MPKGLPTLVSTNIEKARSSAIAAVDVYNRPGPKFRTAHYIVLIIMAWTALFHGYFYSSGRRPWYRKRTSGRGKAIRYQKVNGDPKHWDLSECIRQYFKDNNPPERKNLEFLIELRDKIEHRYLPELDAALYGECQASLLNIEDYIVSMFGSKYALTEQLAISLQFSRTVPQEKKKAAQALAQSMSKSVQEYIEKFRGGLPSTVLNSMKYSFSVFLVPKVANREKAADAAIEFIDINEASEKELERLEKLNVLIKEKQIPIANLDLYKPTQVVVEVKSRLSRRFILTDHTNCWKYYQVRPLTGAENPRRTDSHYCVYDAVHNDYLYTKAWIEKLIEELAIKDTYIKILGRRKH